MQLSNEVTLPATPERVFAVLNDVERVAPCLPGATLEGRTEDDAYRGRVKVKVGPISAAYRGTVRFVEAHEQAKRLVLDARGSDEHGSGNAEAKVTVTIEPDGEGSVLALETDLVIRGKVAQFGKGAIGEISQQLMGRFAENLAGLLREPGPSAEVRDGQATSAQATPGQATPGQATAGEATAGQVAAAGRVPAEQSAALDGLSMVALPLLKRYAPTVAALLLGLGAGVLGARTRVPGRALVDELVTATVHIGGERYRVPARRTVRLLPRR